MKRLGLVSLMVSMLMISCKKPDSKSADSTTEDSVEITNLNSETDKIPNPDASDSNSNHQNSSDQNTISYRSDAVRPGIDTEWIGLKFNSKNKNPDFEIYYWNSNDTEKVNADILTANFSGENDEICSGELKLFDEKYDYSFSSDYFLLDNQEFKIEN
ncbi:MAG: hypothetical protein WBA59_01800 [Moheibacter sp.]